MPRYKFPVDHSYVSNTITADTRSSEENEYRSALETGFPRVLQAIEALWGYRELNDYFRKLMIGEGGHPIAFPQEVWDEIDMLQHIHHALVPDKHISK